MSGGQLMVVLIVTIVMIASIFRARYGYSHRNKRNGHESDTRLGASDVARLHEEVTRLKERIQVLERITVEKENSLERQIEELRDR
jgi:uncharacterized protein YlxW (UPF0749 family)